METATRGDIRDVALLDLSHLNSAEEFDAITSISDVAVVLVSAGWSGALAKVPMKGVASVVPIPDGAEVQLLTGTVTLGAEALADPANEDVVLVATGTVIITGDVQRVTYRQVIVSGIVVAPRGSEGPIGAGLTRVTGSVQYYDQVEGQRFRTLTGSTQISAATLANRGGDPADVLVVTGQTILLGPIEEVGFQRILGAGQLLAPRDAEERLAPALTFEGQLVWYAGGAPRVLSGSEHLRRGFFELFEEPTALLLLGSFTFADDVDPSLLREKVSEVILVGKIVAPEALVPALQWLATTKVGRITSDGDDGDEG